VKTPKGKNGEPPRAGEPPRVSERVTTAGAVLRPPAEELYADELEALGKADKDERPPGWKLSPRAVRTFICGDKSKISRKFYCDDTLVERAIIGLASNRGLLFVGEPGTAKSMLSELLAAAISGTSVNVIQGSAGTTEDQIKYSWNYALLLAEGPTPRALVASPLYVGMRDGVLVRFEEITRCPPEIQDALVSVLSEKAMIVPELEGAARVLLARPGFNVIATANIRDRGVHEMSSALKRRFNFETVHPIRELKLEVDLVSRECERLLDQCGVKVGMDRPIIELLVTAFHDLREGKTGEGIQVEKPTTVMSTAEAVSVAMSAGLEAYYYGGRRLTAEHIARHLPGAVLKDNPDDLKKLKQYVDTVVRQRSKSVGGPWTDLLNARKWLS
jgi:MoxR-like ATPase